MKKFNYIFIVLIFLLIILSCEQYVNFKYQVDDVTQTTVISGKIYNVFTNESVDSARIQIGIRATYSDLWGKYTIHQILRTDENRDKPLPVTATAQDYDSFFGEIKIYPNNNQYDIPLIYVTPILKKISLVPVEEGLITCQILAFDYQGYANIQAIHATFYYSKEIAQHRKEIDRELEFVERVTSLSSHYQCFIPIELEGEKGYFFNKRYKMSITDKEGHQLKLSLIWNTARPDTLLFTPTLP